MEKQILEVNYERHLSIQNDELLVRELHHTKMCSTGKISTTIDAELSFTKEQWEKLKAAGDEEWAAHGRN